MRFLRQSMIGLFLAAATLGLLLFAVQLVRGAMQEALLDERRAPPARERVFAVSVVLAEAETVVPILETFGEVQSRRTLEIRGAVGGPVVELSPSFEDGGAVRSGEVLVQLDPANTQTAVARAKSDVADAQAEGRDAARALALAKDEQAAAQEQAALRQKAFERQRDLGARGVATATAMETSELAASSARQAVLARRQAVTQAEARRDQAATRLTRAELTLAEAERRLADTTLRAPFDGTLTNTNVVVGRLVAANERLAELIDPDDLEVAFRVSTAQYARLLDGDGALIKADVSATLDVAGVDLVAQGRISRASAAAGEGSTGRLIFAALTQSAGFKPGDFVTVRVQEPALENVVRLPSSAIDAGSQVLLIGEGDRLEAQTVRLLRRQGDQVLVRGPIVGREVVAARSPLLGAGIAAKPLRGDRAVPEAPAMVELTEERRAKLIAFIEGNKRMPAEAKQRVLSRLSQPKVPAQMVERIESRMGG